MANAMNGMIFWELTNSFFNIVLNFFADSALSDLTQIKLRLSEMESSRANNTSLTCKSLIFCLQMTACFLY